MLQDRYGNDLTTDSADARDAYVEGMDRFLAAAPDVEAAFQQALAADPDFALAHVAVARTPRPLACPRASKGISAFSIC